MIYCHLVLLGINHFHTTHCSVCGKSKMFQLILANPLYQALLDPHLIYLNLNHKMKKVSVILVSKRQIIYHQNENLKKMMLSNIQSKIDIPQHLHMTIAAWTQNTAMKTKLAEKVLM